MSNSNKETKEKLLQLMRDAVSHDNELREKYKVGEKFRFIRDRLHALRDRVEENVKALQKELEKQEKTISEDEILVYVHIFNAQGMVLQSWQKLLNPTVFYEYSVNRPIYPAKENIESFIRQKSNKSQHGYLTIAVKKVDILPTTTETKDSLGNTIIKVKEGSLHSNKMLSFKHVENEYELNDEGLLVKKK